MQCPKCGHPVSKDDHFCPNCGDLSVHYSFNMMKEDLGDITAVTLQISERLEALQKRFTQFESLFSKSIQDAKQSSPRIQEKRQATEGTFTFEKGGISKKAKSKGAAHEKRKGPAPSSSSPRPFEHGNKGASEIKLGQKWLLIAGVILTVLAVGWFLKYYSFDRNWIGPAGRVAMAYLAGAGFLVVGEFFRRKDYHIFGLYLIGGGVATLYFATFAGFQIYSLISQTVAFGIMVLITILAGVLSLAYNTKWLAILGLMGGFLTPVILSTGVDRQVILMTYIAILNAGILSIAFFKQWRLLNYLGFAFTWLLFSGWYFEYYSADKFWRTTVFLNIFFLFHSLVPFAYHILKEHGKRLLGIGMIMPNSFIAFGYSFAMIQAKFQVEFVSIVTIAYAAIFIWMAHFVHRRDPEQLGAFVMLLAKATLFLVLTVPILFSNHWITFFWAIQAVVVLWAALKLKNEMLLAGFMILMLMTLCKFLFYDYGHVFDLRIPEVYFRGGYTKDIIERFITSLVVLMAAFQSSRLLGKYKGAEDLQTGGVAPALWGIFAVILFLILNFEVGAFFHDYAPQARFAAASVLWAIFSIVLMIYGFLYNRSSLRKTAITLFGVTMIKVFVIDMSNVSTPYRIISFLVLGLMMIGASYLYHRFKEHILSLTSKEEPAN